MSKRSQKKTTDDHYDQPSEKTLEQRYEEAYAQDRAKWFLELDRRVKKCVISDEMIAKHFAPNRAIVARDAFVRAMGGRIVKVDQDGTQRIESWQRCCERFLGSASLDRTATEFHRLGLIPSPNPPMLHDFTNPHGRKVVTPEDRESDAEATAREWVK